MPQTSTSTASLEGESGQQIGDDIELLVPPTKVENSVPVTEVGRSYTNGFVLIGQQTSPLSTGIQAALDILEANGGSVQAWANSGTKAVYHSVDYFYFGLDTPYEEFLALGERTLLVNVAKGTAYTVGRFLAIGFVVLLIASIIEFATHRPQRRSRAPGSGLFFWGDGCIAVEYLR